MGSLLAFGSVVLTLVSLVAITGAYVAHWRQRRAAIRELDAFFKQSSPTKLQAGRATLFGKVRSKKTAKESSVASGRAVSELVQSGRAQSWERTETAMRSRSFDLETHSGERVRVILGKGAKLSVESDAHENNAPRLRIVEWEIGDGDEVAVEGELRRDTAKAEGYRDGRGRWVIDGRADATLLRTRGAIRAWQQTRLGPPSLAIVGLPLIAFCVYGALDLAMVESSMRPAEGIATVKQVERVGRKGKRIPGQDMTVSFKTEEGHKRTCGPIRGDGVTNGALVAIRYSTTDRDRCLRAGEYGRGTGDILYAVASLVLFSGAVAMWLIRVDGWIGSRPWFQREA